MTKKPGVKRRKEKFALRVTKEASFLPADEYTRMRLREKGYRVNDVIFAEFSNPRNPKFHRLAHQFGKIVVENIPSFTGLNAHRALKRLQLEANAACEEIAFELDNGQVVIQRIPMSLAFESMDQSEFVELMRALCRHVAYKYWPTLDEVQVAALADIDIGES